MIDFPSSEAAEFDSCSAFLYQMTVLKYKYAREDHKHARFIEYRSEWTLRVPSSFQPYHVRSTNRTCANHAVLKGPRRLQAKQAESSP